MLENTGTVKKLPECVGIVFVEQCGMSKYSALELKIKRVKDLGKSVVCGVGVASCIIQSVESK